MKKEKIDRLNFEIAKKDKKYVLSKQEQNNHWGSEPKNFVNITNLQAPLSLSDWVDNLKTLKISDGSWDEDFLLAKIAENEERLAHLHKIKSNYKNECADKYSIKHNKHLKTTQKKLEKEVSDYLELVDDVIYNIEVDWNDLHNFEYQLNLYNTTIKTVDDNAEIKSVLIEKPQTHNIEEIKHTQEIIWNSQIIRECKEVHKGNFDAKSYTKYLNSISYSSVANILSKTIDEAFSIKGIINASKNLWEVLSTKKIGLLKTSLFSLLNSLQVDSASVAKIVKQLKKNLIGYTTTPDIELLNDIYYNVDVETILNDLENEINEYRIIFDIILRKYAIAQHIARDLFIKEVKAAANFDERVNKNKNKNGKSKFSENELTIVDKTQSLANYAYANKFRKTLHDSIVEANKMKHAMSKSKEINEDLLNKYFHKINVEAGILYDLSELVKLLELQYKKDKQKNIGLKYIDDLDLREVVSFVYKQGLLIKEISALNMIYEIGLVHLRRLLSIQRDLEEILKTSNQNWLVYFDKWIQFKKEYVTKNKDCLRNFNSNVPLEIDLKPKKVEEKPQKVTKTESKNLKTLKNKFGSSGVKIQEIVNATKIDLQNVEMENAKK